MRQITITLLACAALSGTAFVVADEKKSDASDRAQVIKFLKEHVIDKTVAAPKTSFKLDNNKLEVDSDYQTAFNNFAETREGISFDVTVVAKQTLYDLDKEGKRILPGRDLSGTLVQRYEFGERASTQKMTGIARVLSMTIKIPSQQGMVTLVTGVKIAHGKLSWNETTPGYGDFLAADGKYKPGSEDGSYTFSIVEGKLRTEYHTKGFDVDPDTLQRTPLKEELPPQVAKEIKRK